MRWIDPRFDVVASSVMPSLLTEKEAVALMDGARPLADFAALHRSFEINTTLTPRDGSVRNRKWSMR